MPLNLLLISSKRAGAIRVATFHQIHGGTSTSDEDLAVSRVKEATRAYTALRGHPPRKVRDRGWVFDAATGVMDKG